MYAYVRVLITMITHHNDIDGPKCGAVGTPSAMPGRMGRVWSEGLFAHTFTDHRAWKVKDDSGDSLV